MKKFLNFTKDGKLNTKEKILNKKRPNILQKKNAYMHSKQMKKI